MHRFRVYDIDGTITIPGHDLWYLTTRSLSSDPSRFDQYVESWKKDLSNGASPYESSKLMMQQGLECIDKSCKGDHIKQRARELATDLIQNNHYYASAINHIRTSIDAGFQIVFSTTNYCEVAEAFLDVLVEHHLVKDGQKDKIVYSGSLIDWEARSIIHFNMGDDKVVGISQTLRIPVRELSNHIDSVYGDDPEGNDSGIFSLSETSFVIANPKNSKVYTTVNMIRTSWEDILKNYF